MNRDQSICLGNVRIVDLLISNNASVDCVNRDLQTPLHLAVKKGNFSIGVRSFINRRSKLGEPPSQAWHVI